MDLLAKVFKSFPFVPLFCGGFELSEPWGVTLPKESASVWIVRSGNVSFPNSDNHAGMQVCTGDVVLFTPGVARTLRCGEVAVPAELPQLLEHRGNQGTSVQLANRADGGTTTSLLGGVFDCIGVAAHPLSALLPTAVHLRRTDVATRFERYDEMLRWADRELAYPSLGSTTALNRVLELLFLQVVRDWFSHNALAVESNDAQLHSELWPAVGLIHQHPDRSWTVAELAERVSMSRSAFFANFVEAFDKPPAQYMREHRMKVASQLLRDTSMGLKEIAARTGYDSVTAFNTAFKRQVGVAPGSYRRHSVKA